MKCFYVNKFSSITNDYNKFPGYEHALFDDNVILACTLRLRALRLMISDISHFVRTEASDQQEYGLKIFCMNSETPYVTINSVRSGPGPLGSSLALYQ